MLVGKIQAVLFVAGKPIATDKVVKILGAEKNEVIEALEELKTQLNTERSGLHLIEHDGKLQLVTNPAFAEVIESLVKEEVASELTRPSLETLTIVAYRGPITKPEIEQIRGINCSLILRNLLIRGLIEEHDDKSRLQPVYSLSNTFIRHLGLHSIDELPNYLELHQHESLDQVLAEMNPDNEADKESGENIDV
jgi:segregation and condensation protein B